MLGLHTFAFLPPRSLLIRFCLFVSRPDELVTHDWLAFSLSDLTTKNVYSASQQLSGTLKKQLMISPHSVNHLTTNRRRSVWPSDTTTDLLFLTQHWWPPFIIFSFRSLREKNKSYSWVKSRPKGATFCNGIDCLLVREKSNHKFLV